jgi:molybdenum cofactor cytidylyltransferase
MSIWAVILAAGESKRMGTQKLLLPFGETTIIGAVVRTAAASRVEGVVAVLGADREEVRREIEDAIETAGQGRGDGPGAARRDAASPGRHSAPGSGSSGRSTADGRAAEITVAINESDRLGMLTSIQAGFRALPEDATAAVVMLGDQPFLPPRVVERVIAAYETGRPGIVIPTFQGRRGHPVLIDLKHKDEVLGIEPLDGLRALMRGHPADILEVDVADANILRDLDTPEDYAGLPKPN